MKIKKAIIPAAGLGTRFLPATKAIPKPMLPVYDKPTIQYIVEEAVLAGIEKVAIIVSPDSEIIKNHFSENKILEENLIKTGKVKLYEKALKTRTICDVEFIVQDKPTGLAGAILTAERFVENQPFAMLVGDEIYTSDTETCLQALCREFEETGVSQIATSEVFGDDITKYGNFDFVTQDDGRLKVINLVEKPEISDAFSNMASLGRAVLSPKVFDYIKKSMSTDGTETYMTDAYLMLAENDGLYACPFEGERYDIGDKAGFIKANLDFALKDEKISAELLDFIKNK